MASSAAQGGHVLSVSGTAFLLDGKPFPFTGLSFFNAVYNPAFNESAEERRRWMTKFQLYGINVLRLWCQWDSKRGFVDTGPDCTLYEVDGRLRQEPFGRLLEICTAADELGMVVELALFSQESWHDGIKLAPEVADRAVAEVTRALMPHRNLALQVWNEFSDRAVEHVKTIKSLDPERIVTNSSGFAGVLLAPPTRGELEHALDYLSPHTTRGHGESAAPHWEVAPLEIAYMLARFRKPVVDDEPARNGTAKFGGPTGAVSPYDQILQIYQVWKAGGYIVYHHDMFQTGYGTPAIPPSGIPDPEFNPHHRQVLEFIAQRERYQRLPQPLFQG